MCDNRKLQQSRRLRWRTRAMAEAKLNRPSSAAIRWIASIATGSWLQAADCCPHCGSTDCTGSKRKPPVKDEGRETEAREKSWLRRNWGVPLLGLFIILGIIIENTSEKKSDDSYTCQLCHQSGHQLKLLAQNAPRAVTAIGHSGGYIGHNLPRRPPIRRLLGRGSRGIAGLAASLATMGGGRFWGGRLFRNLQHVCA